MDLNKHTGPLKQPDSLDEYLQGPPIRLESLISASANAKPDLLSKIVEYIKTKERAKDDLNVADLMGGR